MYALTNGLCVCVRSRARACVYSYLDFCRRFGRCVCATFFVRISVTTEVFNSSASRPLCCIESAPGFGSEVLKNLYTQARAFVQKLNAMM